MARKKKRMQRTVEEKQAIIAGIDELKAQGISVANAAAEFNVAATQYNTWKKKLGAAPKVITYASGTKTTKRKQTALGKTGSSERIAVLIGSPSAVLTIMKEMGMA